MDLSDRRCDVSPHCTPLRARLAALGLDPALPWRWVHLGPIGPHCTRLVEHGACRASRRERLVATAGAYGRFAGYRLDLLGLACPPPGTGASYQPMAELWYVAGLAWRHPYGPRAEWRAAPGTDGSLRFVPGADGVSPDFWPIAGRCGDLLTGRLVHRGRPLADGETRWRNVELALRAEEIKARSPDVPYREIARSLGVSERALRGYRAEARRVEPDQSRRLA